MIKALDYVIKIGGVAALLLGLALWSGQLYGLVHLHAALGIGIVVSLWVLAGLAFRAGVGVSLVGTAFVWGLVAIGLGSAQTQILVGSFHWVVQVVHLLAGLGTIAIGAMLAGSIRRKAAT